MLSWFGELAGNGRLSLFRPCHPAFRAVEPFAIAPMPFPLDAPWKLREWTLRQGVLRLLVSFI